MKLIDVLAMILIIVGGLNWGFVGFFGVDLVAKYFGAGAPISMLIYDLIGLAALYKICFWKCIHGRWCSKCSK